METNEEVERIVAEFILEMDNKMYLNDNNWTHSEIREAGETLRKSLTSLSAMVRRETIE